MDLIKRLASSWLVRIGVAIALTPAVAFLYLKLSGHLDPGPVSAMSKMGVMREGYASHADFEKECKHCHAPVHCITANRCQTCHMEIAKQITDADGLHARLPGTDKCQTCHVEHQGREAVITDFPLGNVDHLALTGFSLELHQTNLDGEEMVCHDCHQEGTYAAIGVDCAACHSAENGALASDHAGRFGGDCVECHDGADRMLTFAHETHFTLEGAHADTDCEACHADHVFAGRAQDCSACHDGPAHHAGQFGLDCARCHTAIAWTPAELRHHTFDLNHQSDGPIDCVTCHVDTYVVYACDGCHEHNMEVTVEQHTDEEAADLRACVECHPTGTQEEIAHLLANPPSHAAAAAPAPGQGDN